MALKGYSIYFTIYSVCIFDICSVTTDKRRTENPLIQNTSRLLQMVIHAMLQIQRIEIRQQKTGIFL